MVSSFCVAMLERNLTISRLHIVDEVDEQERLTR